MSRGVGAFVFFEVWLSLVERYVRDVEAASSNLVTSIKEKESSVRMAFFLMKCFDLYL